MRSENFVLIDNLRVANPGCFARCRAYENGRYRIDHWFYCRDIFHHVLSKLDIFFFSHKIGQSRGIIAFMLKAEEMLCVSPRSDYGLTQRKTVMWVRPSSWWIRHAMRRSLFTILLRAGLEYDAKIENFKETLLKDKYLCETIYAVERFFSGHTRYVGRKRGWHKQFFLCNPSKQEIDRLLAIPK